MKKFFRAIALSAMLAFSACTLSACATGDTGLTVLQTEAAGYDTLKGLADTADDLCNKGTLKHDTCVTVRDDLRQAKTLLDTGHDITGLVTQIGSELKQ